MTYGIGNPGHDLGQPKICGRFKQVNGIPTLAPFIIGSSSTIQIKPPHIHLHNIIKQQQKHLQYNSRV
jgi:hypothetical protein